MTGPLAGLRVVELTTAWAGPMAGRVLAFLGAEVIHVESPTRVNSWRQNKDIPNPLSYPDREPGERYFDRSFLFNSQNMNKRSCILDLKTPEGKEVLRGMIAVADVVTCNFRPGMLARLGFDYPRLCAIRPDIILAEMPAYGTTGPDSSYAALGPTMEMAAGMSSMVSYRDGQPVVTGPSYLDPIGGFNGASAILAALNHRRRTGEGQHIEVPQVEAAMQLIGGELLAAQFADGPPPDGNHVLDMAPHNAYPASGVDEWIVIACRDDQAFKALCSVMGQPELAADARFHSLEQRLANQQELDALIGQWSKDHDRHELAERLQSAGVAAAPVNNSKDIAESAYLAHRGFFTELTHPHAGTHPHPGLPIHLSRTPGSARTPAPAFGADNAYVLREILGLSPERAGAIAASGAMTDRPNPGA